MLVKVINPNTSRPMTESIERSARAVAGMDVRAVTASMGPASIESHYDEALAVPGVLAEIGDADGYVIACFGDPGLDAAREVADGPVVGMAEAAMRTASYLGRGFSVVTTVDRSRGRTWDLAERYGVARFCRGVHACGIRVLDLDGDPGALKTIAAVCRYAVERDESDAIVLGCAGMTHLVADLTAEVGVPVVDGVQAATLAVRSLLAMGLRTGKTGEFAAPPPKPYGGLLREFTR
ncbi:aspartate/glutamate racemase family protein [Actinophytocola sp.]|uniref:aspartate/glutamate racemase family protein n=1 Tax=Actinophytocola sp. TaxID=1872138 RepID=UPI002D378C6E|nr:aspartate/glutamate racemase family protein [Actinophytocola sp.]HYQ67522.1 aspartate/glutamate racemase family protein [Actinophytocola sp.]